MKEAEEAKAAEEAANAGPQKKEAPEVEKFITTYYEFPGNFTTNLRGSRKFLQAGIGVSTQYDDNVITNVEDHQLSLRSSILAVMSEFSEQDIEGKSGRDALAKAIAAELNTKLEALEGFGGIENVHLRLSCFNDKEEVLSGIIKKNYRVEEVDALIEGLQSDDNDLSSSSG